MSDLISREEAIDAVEKSRRANCHQDRKAASAHEYEHRHFLKILRDLTSAEPQWIPVSKRLPKESGIYLVTLKTDGVAYLESEFPNGFVYVSTYDAVIMNWGYGGKDVIAWMPLPKPYKGE